MKITAHTTLRELTKSITAERLGIDNTPNDDILVKLKFTCEKVFEPVRMYFGQPISITSAYRSVSLNEAIGGSKNSQHCKGEALDIDADVYGGLSNADIFYFVLDNLVCDQLIWEYGDANNPAWVHVSYTTEKNRKQALIAYRDDKGKTKYKLFPQATLHKIF